MNEHLNMFKVSLSVVLGALASFLGWKGVLLVILVLVMFTDYVSGTLAARKNGEWNSTVAREGLFHKGGTILIVLMAFIFDLMLYIALPNIPFIGGNISIHGLFLPLVSVWYIITEIGSIMENAIKMGAYVPKWFKKAVINTGTIIDKTAESVTPSVDDSDSGDEDDTNE